MQGRREKGGGTERDPRNRRGWNAGSEIIDFEKSPISFISESVNFISV